jgi:cytochrome b561
MISQPSRYSHIAIFLHWLMALLMIGLLGLGFYISSLDFSPSKLKLLNWHKMFGLTVFFLFIIRILWRSINRPPPLPDHMSTLEKALAHSVHAALYLLMIAIPLSGLLYSQSAGFNVNWFNLFTMPRIIEPDPNLAHTLKETHELLTKILIGLLIAHLGAVIKHQWIRRDNLLQRMSFSRKKP